MLRLRPYASPGIDKFATQGVLFENVISHSPWTLPSFASIFTSLFPTQHGVPLSIAICTDHPTPAMMLLKKGYSTAAIINAPFLRPEFKLDRGFEFMTTGRHSPTALPTAPRLTRWRGSTGMRESRSSYSYTTSTPTFLTSRRRLMTRGSPPAMQATLRPRSTSTSSRGPARLISRPWSPLAEDWDYIRALYDGEIAFTDKAVGELLAGLDRRNLRESTLIIFLSDHGEEFFEHEGFEHGHTLYDEVIKVPLIVSLPGQVPETQG